MRITGGRMRGRRLAALRGLNIRPTADKVREAVFDLVGQDMTEINTLDLFAGTGSVGVEALSRGASWALFIDNSPRSINLIKRNLMLCGCGALGSVVKRDLARPLNWKSLLRGKGFGLVFIDPPYGKNLVPPVLETLSQQQILASPSTVVAESSKTDELPVAVGNLNRIDKRTYGDTTITLYRYEEDR